MVKPKWCFEHRKYFRGVYSECPDCLAEREEKLRSKPKLFCEKHQIEYTSRRCIDCIYDDLIREEKRYIGHCIGSTFSTDVYDEIHRMKILELERQRLRARVYNDPTVIQKHTNEPCSSRDKPISFDEWFCYCSLCPDCYMQIPEDEIERMDKEFKLKILKHEENTT